MKEKTIQLRNLMIKFCYKSFLKPIYFQMDPEKIHDRMVKVGRFLGSSKLTQKATSLCFSYQNKALQQNLLGINFSNPLGLAAGFDKDAKLTDILPAVGFGFMEIGSITGEPCLGNPPPRLCRLKKSQGLWVNYGLKNEGCEKISQILQPKNFKIPLGTNIAKTNCEKKVNTEEGIKDYVKAFQKLANIGSYFTINISCPNAFGGQPFTDAERLNSLLQEIEKILTIKPVFLKLSPDLTKKEIDQIIMVSQKHKVHGFICTNLAKNRNNKKILEKNLPEKGGFSGKIIDDLSTEMISYIHHKTKGKYILIGCGGVFSPEDAYRKIKAGASLVQLITGMIFEGPQVISEINQGLVKLLQKDGFNHISEAVGKSP